MDLKIIDDEIWLGTHRVARFEEGLPHWLRCELRDRLLGGGQAGQIYHEGFRAGRNWERARVD